jgi:hypothetical protein
MATNNVLQWDGPLANAESDAAYAADASRVGGAAVSSLLASATFNKFAANISGPVAALCQSLANKGITISDANYANLVSAFTNIVIESDLGAALAIVSFASSIAFDASTISPRVGAFQLTLTGNVSPTTLANTTAGQVLIFIIIQDGTGGHTFAWPSSVTGGVVVNPVAGSLTVQAFVVAATGAIVPLVPTPSNVSTQSTPSNSLNTVYRNTGSTPRFVSVTVGCPSGAYAQAVTDAGSSPSTPVGTVGTVSPSVGGSYAIHFIVLPGNYYAVNTEAGAPYPQAWVEWQ